MQALCSVLDVEHQLQQTTFVLFAVTDKELNVLTSNSLFQSTFGKSADTYFKNDLFMRAVDHSPVSQNVHFIDQEFIQADKGERWQLCWEQLTMRNEQGQITGFSFLGTYRIAANKIDTSNYAHAAFTEHSNDAVITTDINFSILSFNRTAEKIYQLTKEAVIGKHINVLEHEFEHTTEWLQEKQLLEKRNWEGELYFTRQSDQQKVNLYSTITAVCNEKHEVVGYMCINQNISKQRELEMKLVSVKQIYEGYLEAFSKGVVIQNNKGEILFCNSEAEQILGLTREQMIGKSSACESWRCVREDFSPLPRNEQPAMFCLQTGKPLQNVIMGIYKPDEEVTWINASANPVIDVNTGTVNATVTVFTDISSERKAFRHLSESENRIRLALDKTGDNAWEYNFKTNTAWFSAANNHFLGYSSEELNERENHDKWWQNTHPDDKFLLIKNDEEYRAGVRESHSLEYRIFHKDGTMKWVLDRGVVIERDETGMPVRIVGTHTDITNEKKMHLELMTQNDQKRKDTVEAVLQAQENERDYIANELHEGVAQVLASVKMILDRAANNPSVAGDELHIASEKITGVVNELKSISQNINTSSLKMLGLSQTISDYVESVSGMSDVNFHLDLSDFDYEIEIDYPVQLALLRIIQEKVKNIIRHSGAANGYVKLAVHSGMVHLCMKDDGVGFDTDNNKLGLGFKNIYSRAEQYNGKVSITSSKGNGCQLEVKLPVAVNRRTDKQSAA